MKKHIEKKNIQHKLNKETLRKIEPLLSEYNEIQKNKLLNYLNQGKIDKVMKICHKKECTKIVNKILDCEEKDFNKNIKDIDINLRDEWGYTILMRAIMNNDKNKVKLLIEKGANVNLRHHIIESAWKLAIKINNYEIKEMVLKKVLIE